MQPRRKRPRLSVFADEPLNAELDTARIQNDRHLKGRFEAIFQKYERDFSGVGDEVDLSTGEIIVNNGHLAGLTEQIDTRSEADESKGEPSTPESNSSPGRRRLLTDGRSMLRAMTVAPNRENAYFDDENADDVIESIETIAENAALADQDDPDETNSEQSEEGSTGNAEDVVDAAADIQNDEPIHIPILATTDLHENEKESSDSDDDSLFNVPDERESSPDSLFEQPTAASSATPHEEIDPTPQFFDSLGDLDEEAIFTRFGDEIGQEVLDLIQKRDKAELHIEAAWRIPVQLELEEPPSNSPATSSKRKTSDTRISPDPLTPKKGAVLWNLGPQRRSKAELHQDRTMRVIRAESEDPLQEGFGDSGQVQVRVAEVSLDRATRLLNRGMCPYCKEQFFNPTAAREHLSAVLETLKTGSPKDSTHSVDRINGLMSAIKQAEEGEHDAPLLADDDNVIESVESEVPGKGSSMAELVGDDGSESTPRAKDAGDTGSDTDESVDDLFVDAGHIHNGGMRSIDSDKALHSTHRPTSASATRKQGRAAGQKMTRVEAQDSETKPVKPSLIIKLRFGQRRPPNSPPQRGAFGAPALGSPGADELDDYPEFQETSDPFDRTGSRNYRGHLPETQQPQLSLRPRKAKRNVSYALPPKPRPPSKRIKQAKRSTMRKDTAAQKSNFTQRDVSRTSVRTPHAARRERLTDGGRSSRISDAFSDSVSEDDFEEINAAFEQIPRGHDNAQYRRSVEVGDEEDSDDVSNAGVSPEPVYHFTVSDFKCLVVHHEIEGAGLEPFGEIMTNHYNNYRRPKNPVSGSKRQPEWSECEDLLLHGLSLNPETLMETIKRRLPSRSSLDIGNKLAQRWITESSLPEHAPGSLEEPYLAAFKRGALKQGDATESLLDLLDADLLTEDLNSTSAHRGRKRSRAEPLRRRICRTQSPGGTWLGCGRVYSQRSAVVRHWKETGRACLVPGYMARQEPSRKKRTRATKENGLPCRSTSPGGTERGCHKLFKQKSALYRHWRTNGAKCRPPEHRIPDLTSSDVEEEIAESDHGQGDALDGSSDAVQSSASTHH